MGSENQPGLSESEREVLRVLWFSGYGFLPIHSDDP